MNSHHRIILLSVFALPCSSFALEQVPNATRDLFAMFPPTLTAKEAQEKWETNFKSKCKKETDQRTVCRTKKTNDPAISEIVLALNPKEHSIEMLTVHPNEGTVAEMNRAETLRKIPKYDIRCDQDEMSVKVSQFRAQTKCQGNSTLDLIVEFDDQQTPDVVDFKYQSALIIEAMENVAPNTKHSDVWLKAVAVFKDMLGDETKKPAWFNGEFIDYQHFPFVSFYFKTKHKGNKHTIEASWMEP